MDINNLIKLEQEGYFILKNSFDQKTIKTFQEEFEGVMIIQNPAVKDNYFYFPCSIMHVL